MQYSTLDSIQGYETGVDQCAPANALDALAEGLGNLEMRIRDAGSRGSGIVARVFGDPTAPNQVSKGEHGIAPREPASIPAIANRIERIGGLLVDVEVALSRLSGL